MKRVYQTDQNGVFLYESHASELPLSPGSFNIPFGAVEDAPPAAPAGMVAQQQASGWSLVEDHRADELWAVSTGAPYHLGDKVGADGQMMSYSGLGPVPDWLTQSAPIQAVDEVSDN